MLRRLVRSLLLLLVTATIPAPAQNTLSVRGYVVEATGSAIPGIPMRLSRAGTLVHEIESDAAGNFVFTGLHAGDFLLDVPAFSGFAPRTLPLHLTASVTGFKVSLALAAVSQEVTVGADQTLAIDSSSNLDTVSVTADSLRVLPVFDQDYISALTPFLDASSGSSGGVTLIVDGVEMKSVGVSPSSIQEVRINNDPYSSEFTRPGRGRIEITTKPGSQLYHGEADFLIRDATFNAKNRFAVTRPPEARRLFDGHITGPVGHGGHTNFIASGVYGQRNTAAAVNAIGPNGPVNQNVLTPQRNSQASLRVTHDFSPAHRLQAGYNFEYYSDVNSGVGGLVLPAAGVNDDSREDDAIFNDRIIVTPNLINQLLVTFEKDEDVSRSVTNAQAIQVNGAFTGGGAQGDLNRTENTIHINEVVSWSHGKHYIRFGAQLPQFSKRAVDDHTNRLGTFGFASLSDYVANRPYVFTAQQGIGRGLYWTNEIGAFFQDQIKVTAKLQVSLGFRYDWQTYLSDNNNFSPRVSLAYAPDKGKTILRAGVGIFYDRTGGDYPATFKLHNGVVLDSVQLQNPTYPLAPGTTFSAAPSNIVREASNIRAPYTIQSSLGIERQLNKKVTVTAAYRNSVQVKSFRSRDANAPILPANPQPYRRLFAPQPGHRADPADRVRRTPTTQRLRSLLPRTDRPLVLGPGAIHAVPGGEQYQQHPQFSAGPVPSQCQLGPRQLRPPARVQPHWQHQPRPLAHPGRQRDSLLRLALYRDHRHRRLPHRTRQRPAHGGWPQHSPGRRHHRPRPALEPRLPTHQSHRRQGQGLLCRALRLQCPQSPQLQRLHWRAHVLTLYATHRRAPRPPDAGVLRLPFLAPRTCRSSVTRARGAPSPSTTCRGFFGATVHHCMPQQEVCLRLVARSEPLQPRHHVLIQTHRHRPLRRTIEHSHHRSARIRDLGHVGQINVFVSLCGDCRDVPSLFLCKPLHNFSSLSRSLYAPRSFAPRPHARWSQRGPPHVAQSTPPSPSAPLPPHLNPPVL